MANLSEIVVNVNLSLRDYFAASAMQGILANVWSDTRATNDEIAKECYDVADSMLRQREVKDGL